MHMFEQDRFHIRFEILCVSVYIFGRFVWGCIKMWLKRGRWMYWEVGLRYGVGMNHIITLESIKFFFF